MLGGFIWDKLDKLSPGQTFKDGQIKIHTFAELLEQVRNLPVGSLWRHNRAGDLSTTDRINIDADKLQELTAANTGRRGFTYTHHDVLTNEHNRAAVRKANEQGFTVNLSGNSLEHADQLADLNIAPVTTVVPEDFREGGYTPKGRKVVICPAVIHKDMTCFTCGICAKLRKAIIAFPALGAGKQRMTNLSAPVA